MRIIFLFVVLSLLSSCSLEKRSFRKGYYVDWLHKKKAQPVAVKCNKVKKSNPVVFNDIKDDAVYASAGELQPPSFTMRNIQLPPDTCPDLIYFKNGGEEYVKEIEVTEKEIKYKRCNKEYKGFTRKNPKEIVKIKYSNGTIKYLDTEEAKKNREASSPGSGCTDSIYFANGKIENVNIISLTNNGVFYKPCGGDTTLSAKKEDLLKVKFANQVIDNFQSAPVLNNNPKPAIATPKIHPLVALMAFCFILSIFFMVSLPFPVNLIVVGILNIVDAFAGHKAKKDIKKFPDKYKGKGLINFLRVLFWILTVLFFSATPLMSIDIAQ